MRHDFHNLSYSEIEDLINQWILNEKYRKILKWRLLDGKTYDDIADKLEMSPRHIKRIVYKAEEKFFNHK